MMSHVSKVAKYIVSLPRVVIGFACLLLSCSIIACSVGSVAPLWVLNEGQILYLYSTSAQVLAGIYGLTLAGFVFLRNELSREVSEDETLEEPVQNLKERYYKVLLFVTFITVVTLLLANLVMSSVDNSSDWLTTLFMNLGQVSFLVSLLAIAYFVCDIVAPRSIREESNNIRDRADPVEDAEDRGSMEVFLRNYNMIERCLQRYGQSLQPNAGTPSSKQGRISNSALAEMLFQEGVIDEALSGELKNLIRVRNSIVHGADPVVSRRMVEGSQDICRLLQGSVLSSEQ